MFFTRWRGQIRETEILAEGSQPIFGSVVILKLFIKLKVGAEVYPHGGNEAYYISIIKNSVRDFFLESIFDFGPNLVYEQRRETTNKMFFPEVIVTVRSNHDFDQKGVLIPSKVSQIFAGDIVKDF